MTEYKESEFKLFEGAVTDKWFNCGCQEWRLTNLDFTNQAPDQNDIKVHTCSKIEIYQKANRMARIFNRKNFSSVS